MAAPQGRSLADLPPECLCEIIDRVRCPEDRRNAYLAFTAFLKVLKDNQPAKLPPALPWLLLPATDPDYSARVVCVLSGYRDREHRIPYNTLLRGGRCFGSQEGAWLFLQSQGARGHVLLNVRTGQALKLPNVIKPRAGGYQSLAIKMVVRAAALSSSRPDDASCVAVFIVRMVDPPCTRCVAFWHVKCPEAIEIRRPGQNRIAVDAEDVVYHDGVFHLLDTSGDHISVCDPVLLADGSIEVKWEKRHFHPAPAGLPLDQHYIRQARYLVVSRGEILLVIRLRRQWPCNQPTSMFRVFRATKRPQMPDDDHFPVARHPWEWSELDTLGGRLLFVGYGCSRSYEAHQYNDLEAGIYFLDDGKFYDGNAMPRLYPCRDNGFWSDDNIQCCFPVTEPSSYSPSAWLLP